MSSLTDLVSDDGKKEELESYIVDKLKSDSIVDEVDALFVKAFKEHEILDVECNGEFIVSKDFMQSLKPEQAIVMMSIIEKRRDAMKMKNNKAKYVIIDGALSVIIDGGEPVTFAQFLTVMWNGIMFTKNGNREEAMKKMKEVTDSLKFYEYYRLSTEEQGLFKRNLIEMNVDLEKKLRDESDLKNEGSIDGNDDYVLKAEAKKDEEEDVLKMVKNEKEVKKDDDKDSEDDDKDSEDDDKKGVYHSDWFSNEEGTKFPTHEELCSNVPAFNYSGEYPDSKDPTFHCGWEISSLGFMWLIMAYDPKCSVAYGYARIHCGEYGAIDMDELREAFNTNLNSFKSLFAFRETFKNGSMTKSIMHKKTMITFN